MGFTRTQPGQREGGERRGEERKIEGRESYQLIFVFGREEGQIGRFFQIRLIPYKSVITGAHPNSVAGLEAMEAMAVIGIPRRANFDELPAMNAEKN
jgi:hypothetical protein